MKVMAWDLSLKNLEKSERSSGPGKVDRDRIPGRV